MKWLKNITSFCVWITQIQPWLWVADSKAQLELQMALDCDTRFTPACVARKIPNLDFKHFTAACAYLCPGPCYGQGNGVLPLPHVCSEVSASASPSHGPSPSLWAQQRSAWAEKAWQSNTSQKAKLQLKILQPKIVLTFFSRCLFAKLLGLEKNPCLALASSANDDAALPEHCSPFAVVSISTHVKNINGWFGGSTIVNENAEPPPGRSLVNQFLQIFLFPWPRKKAMSSGWILFKAQHHAILVTMYKICIGQATLSWILEPHPWSRHSISPCESPLAMSLKHSGPLPAWDEGCSVKRGQQEQSKLSCGNS